MQDIDETVRRYIDMWNTTDGEARRAIIARVWDEEAVSIDPMTLATGHDEIDAMVAAFQRTVPGQTFSRVGEIHTHHDRARFHWQMVDPDGQLRLTGLDCVTLAEDGRIRDLCGFFDGGA